MHGTINIISLVISRAFVCPLYGPCIMQVCAILFEMRDPLDLILQEQYIHTDSFREISILATTNHISYTYITYFLARAFKKLYHLKKEISDDFGFII